MHGKDDPASPHSPLPYAGLSYPHLREAHDRICFAPWRRATPTLSDLHHAYRQLGSFLDSLERELNHGSPGRAKEYLTEARESHRQADATVFTGSAVFLAINNALSYGHRVLDILLRAKGETNHISRDFAQYYDSTHDEE